MKNFDLLDKKKHFEAFFNCDYYERCNLSMRVLDDSFVETPIDNYTVDGAYLDPVYMSEKYKETTRKHIYMGEAFAHSNTNFGTAGHAEYFGTKPHYTPNTVWFEEFMEEPDVNLLKYDEKPYLKHLEIVKKMCYLADDQYMVSMPDNCGIMDALAMMRGNENLLIDMIEEPEFVKEALKKITEVWKKTQAGFFDATKENCFGGSVHSWMQLWCEERHAQIQCDYSVMISPDMYEEFILPELIETSSFLDKTTYHLDGQEQIRHLDHILSVKTINNIQWTPVAGQPFTSEFIPVLQKIQKAGKGLVLIPKMHEIKTLIDNLSPKGLQIVTPVLDSVEDANDLIKYAINSAKSK